MSTSASAGRRGSMLLCFFAMAAACAAVLGCSSNPSNGYSLTPAHSTAVRTVHVELFENPTYARGLEVELTDAIIKEIRASTPWRVVSADTAQTTLSGTLTQASLRRLSTGRDTGLAQELAVSMRIDFDWRDNRSGKSLVARREFQASEPFAPGRPANERLEVGQNAAIQRLARDLVAELRSSW